jgi:glycosyltransferase involved in cell wall biosynthesis
MTRAVSSQENSFATRTGNDACAPGAMKLSIAMCTYFGERFLGEQLESISAQTRLPDELVICDDGSTDGTRQIIEEYAARAPFQVRVVVNPKNVGPAANFGGAISLCGGEIIALSDQDDVWHPQKLERVLDKFSREPDAGGVFTDAEAVDEQTQSLGYRIWAASSTRLGARELAMFNEGHALDVLLKRNVVTGATLAFRGSLKNLILPIPGFECMLHDCWIALLIGAASKLAFIDEPLIKYRCHANQHSGLSFAPEQDGGIRLIKYPLPGLVYQRLLLHRKSIKDRAVIGRMKHLSVRTEMEYKRFPMRIWFGLGEIATLRYHKYSRGFRSAAADVLPVGVRRFIPSLRRHKEVGASLR